MKSFFKLKTLLSRLIVSFVVVIAVTVTMLCTLVVAQQDESLRAVFIAVTCAVALVIAVLSILFNYRVMIVPMKDINNMTDKITKGEFATRCDEKKVYDTDILQLINNFNQMATEFENSEQMRRTFISNASHELRSPLTSMQGFIQGVLDGTIPQSESRKYLNVVLSETKRLASMISSMLDLSRIESGKFPVKKSRFEINETIRRILIKFEPHITKKDITLNIDFINEYSYVYADKSKIEQVLVNLVDNAIKYSPSSTTIQITTHIHGTKLYVSVKDEGIGISKKDQMLIWDRFYMADKARTPGKAKGTGLGLAIVKKIVDDHKEIIWVESDKGQGTTFIFTLELFNPGIHDKLTVTDEETAKSNKTETVQRNPTWQRGV